MKASADTASTSSWHARLGVEIVEAPAEIPCPRCTFLNDKLAGSCAVCEKSLNHAKTTDSNIVFISSSDEDEDDDDGKLFVNVDDDDGAGKISSFGTDVEKLVCLDDEIVCARCTLINKVGTSFCVACQMPLNEGHKDHEVAHAGPSCSHVYVDGVNTKFRCGRCTFLNDFPSTTCACCGFDLEVKKLRVEDEVGMDPYQAESDLLAEHPIICEVCKGSFGSRSSGHELSNCNHGFCRACLSTAVVNNLLDLIKADATNQVLSKYERALRCPAEGCIRSLGRGDLQLVVGSNIQGMLDEWLMTFIANQVVCPLVRCCPQCRDFTRQVLVLPNQFHMLRQRELRRAFNHNGLTLTYQFRSNKLKLAEHLRVAAPFSSLCSVCFCLVCQKCGTVRPPGVAHQCDPLLKQCSDISHAIMKLGFAYIQATRASDENRGRKKARVGAGFSSSADKPKQSEDGGGLFFNIIQKWFSVKDLEDMAGNQSTALHQQQVNYDSQKEPSQREKGLLVDRLARSALEELTNSVLKASSVNKDLLPPLVVTLLCSHDMPHTLLKWLVSNDSIMDVTTRCELYWAVLGFLRAVSSSWDLLPLLCSPGAKHDCFTTKYRWQTPGSPMAHFEMLFKQAQFMLRRGDHLHLLDSLEIEGPEELRKEQLEHARVLLPSLVEDVASTYSLLRGRIVEWEVKTLQHPWSATSQHVSDSMALGSMADDPCQIGQRLYTHLQNFVNRIALLSSSDTGPSRVSAQSAQADTELDSYKLTKQMSALEDAVRESDASAKLSLTLVEAYKRALKPLQFDEACLMPTHYFRQEVAKCDTLMLNKRRARAISEEMIQLNTILPLEWESSIFLRIDEERMDVLRALIIGPEGTPYENGVFLFDLLLEESYPDTPPRVQFLTTGGGTVRFNPNLYQCGKVCLSLLGTWQGPGWTAGKSSIMQVLVSIQGLIFVADPYFNEPGTVGSGMRHAADAYICEQRINTLRHSILPALRSPDRLFLPVIRTHLHLKSHYILEQCSTWMQEDLGAANQFKPLIQQLRCELDMLPRLM